MATINRDLLVAFFEATRSTNFEIIARASGWEGGVAPSIIVRESFERLTLKPRNEIVSSLGGRMIYGQENSFNAALNAAKGHDYVLACELLVTSNFFYQVEVKPLSSIQVADVWGQQPNPLRDSLEPLIWRIDHGEVTGHGGARQGAGRPAVLGESRLISLDMELSMIAALDEQAKVRGISRAEFMRALIATGLSTHA